jgi:hypothetical protein
MGYRLCMKRAIIITLFVVALGACSSEDGVDAVDAVDATEEAATTTSPTTTSATPATEPATTTTSEPADECLSNTVRFVGDHERERCEDGRWVPDPVPTAAPTSSTSSTSSTTTTTDAPGADTDIEALFLLNGIISGDAPDVVDAIVTIFEGPTLYDRVDVLTARIAGTSEAYLVLSGPSGYSGEEYQLEVARDVLTTAVEVWQEIPQFAGDGKMKVGLDFTVDDRQWVVPFDQLDALRRRQVTPEDVLGI